MGLNACCHAGAGTFGVSADGIFEETFDRVVLMFGCGVVLICGGGGRGGVGLIVRGTVRKSRKQLM